MKRLAVMLCFLLGAVPVEAAIMLSADGDVGLSGNSFNPAGQSYRSGMRFGDPTPLSIPDLRVTSGSSFGSGIASASLTAKMGSFQALIHEQVSGDFSVAGDASVHGEWRDTLSLSAAPGGPAVGTPITITTRTIVHIESIESLNATWHLWLKRTNGVNVLSINNSTNPGGIQDQTFEIVETYTGSIGGSISIGQVFDAKVRTEASTGGAGHATIDAMNTVNFYISAPQGVVLSSESGHNYSQAAVPEPGSLLLWGAGTLATVLSVARRRMGALTQLN